MVKRDGIEKIHSVMEQRITPLFIGILLLLSLFTVELFKLIPIAVLGGIFLFMGYSKKKKCFLNYLFFFFMSILRPPLPSPMDKVLKLDTV